MPGTPERAKNCGTRFVSPSAAVAGNGADGKLFELAANVPGHGGVERDAEREGALGPGALDHAGAAVVAPAREVGDLGGRAAVGGGELPQRDRAGDRRGAAAARAVRDPAQQRELARALGGLGAARGGAAVAEHDQLRALRPHLERLARRRARVQRFAVERTPVAFAPAARASSAPVSAGVRPPAGTRA